VAIFISLTSNNKNARCDIFSTAPASAILQGQSLVCSVSGISRALTLRFMMGKISPTEALFGLMQGILPLVTRGESVTWILSLMLGLLVRMVAVVGDEKLLHRRIFAALF
jgi:hypothetical protein